MVVTKLLPNFKKPANFKKGRLQGQEVLVSITSYPDITHAQGCIFYQGTVFSMSIA